MYIFSERFNPVEIWRGVIVRKLELLGRIAHKFFLPGERYAQNLDPDGLGAWIAVDGTQRPEELLKAIKQEAFPTFAFLGVRFDGQRHWTHFRALV